MFVSARHTGPSQRPPVKTSPPAPIIGASASLSSTSVCKGRAGAPATSARRTVAVNRSPHGQKRNGRLPTPPPRATPRRSTARTMSPGRATVTAAAS
ncbi:MAG: hypothetical protein LBW77_07415 [Verrucomicrobiota bacterium]|jgi:hypothetical protein|nr:hypothetical protein [Verrucomicrobiota bacterium]